METRDRAAGDGGCGVGAALSSVFRALARDDRDPSLPDLEEKTV